MSVFVLLFSVCAWGAGPKTDPVDPMYGRMVRLIEDRYLRLDEFDPAAAFVAAAEEAEGAVADAEEEREVRAVVRLVCGGAMRREPNPLGGDLAEDVEGLLRTWRWCKVMEGGGGWWRAGGG